MLKGVVSALCSFGLIYLLIPHYIRFLQRVAITQSVSEYSLEEYKNKGKTPIMGGVLFVLIPCIFTLLFYPQAIMDMKTVIVILAFVGYGLIGFIDDFIIAIQHNNEGLKPRYKFLFQLILAVVFYLIYSSHADLSIAIPLTDVRLNLGWLYAFLVFFMFTGSSNAVNLTDGMDGLSAGCSVLSLIPFVAFSFMQGQMPLVCLTMSVIGGLFAYLCYNISPARIFMGDTGSLALGGLFAALAMVLKVEILLVIIGGVFVWETLCVMLQIGSVKIRHKRIFRYTPIHYSFVLGGMAERTVVRHFWCLAAIFSLVGLLLGVIG